MPSRSLVVPIGRLFLFAVVLVTGCADPVSLAEEEGTGALAPVLASSSCTPGISDAMLAEYLGDMADGVRALADAGALNEGQSNALLQHLTNARRMLERESHCAARAQLDAFRSQVDEFVRDGILSDREAYELRRLWRLTGEPPQVNAPGDWESYAPGVTGEPRILLVDGEELHYEVIDGLAIFTGDIILGYADEVEAMLGGDRPALTGTCSGSNAFCGRWSDGVVGYDFVAFDWGGSEANDMMVSRIMDAINHWRARTGMTFERRSSGERIVFRNSTGCSSWIGRQEITGFEPQWVNVGTHCVLGTVIHEIGHAVGLFHEQSRNDRDDHVSVNFDVIQFDRIGNFFQYLTLGSDVGAYDYGSIMHYRCDAFQNEGATRPSIELLDPDASCGDRAGQAGQRVGLSEGDVLGAYWLYRPRFEIAGATSGETRDRFELSLDFSTKPVDDAYIQWTVNRNRVSTGPTFSTVEQGLAPGTYVIGADIMVGGVLVAFRAITITLENEPPQVNLGPDRDVDMRRDFNVFAQVTDAEDGACPPTVCTYTWDPVPNGRSDAGSANYRFDEEGPRTIRVRVRDGAGLEASDEVIVNVVDSPPAVVLESPPPGSVFNPGSTVTLVASATDANDGDGPGPEPVDCLNLRWSVEGGDDRVIQSQGCSSPLLLGAIPGTRTVTVTAQDQTGNRSSATRTFEVAACEGNCPPSVEFDIRTEPELDGSVYSPPFEGDGYYLESTLELEGRFSDPEGNNPVSLEWFARAPCFIGPSCPEAIEIAGTLRDAPGTYTIAWRPSDTFDSWGNCSSVALPFEISLRATDSTGASRTFQRIVYLACALI